ncbi:uncharacterized protein CEXT_171331 [Caerostris extrusa]|uniref:Uncharacterized protein n=1 Tax=Caerostris extrusa TaxID=172846 RepID=A0AAV4Y3P0_CAEEX|nr:uncharacterized protein CEXT_171331 [Caerostris extrusa]
MGYLSHVLVGEITVLVSQSDINQVFARTSDCNNIHNDNHCVCLSGNVQRFFQGEKCEKLLPECKCSVKYQRSAILTCQNVSDFEAFDHILSNGSVFEVNTAFYITCLATLFCPKGFLSGLVVAQLSVDGFQTQVEEGAFDGVLELHGISVKSSSMKEIPDFRAIRSSLWDLMLDNSRLTQLRGDNLKSLTRLRKLSFVNNSIAHVADDGTENVVYFDISHNLLTSLPPRLFRSWKRLETVRLSYNQLLHVNHLFIGTNPWHIFLNNNNISDFSRVLHDSMRRLMRLKLSQPHQTDYRELVRPKGEAHHLPLHGSLPHPRV